MMTEIEVYKALLKRLTGEDVEIEKSQNLWFVKDSFGNWGANWDLPTACFNAFARVFADDILAYVNEPDSALDSNAQALKRHYLALLGGGVD